MICKRRVLAEAALASVNVACRGVILKLVAAFSSSISALADTRSNGSMLLPRTTAMIGQRTTICELRHTNEQGQGSNHFSTVFSSPATGGMAPQMPQYRYERIARPFTDLYVSEANCATLLITVCP